MSWFSSVLAAFNPDHLLTAKEMRVHLRRLKAIQPRAVNYVFMLDSYTGEVMNPEDQPQRNPDEPYDVLRSMNEAQTEVFRFSTDMDQKTEEPMSGTDYSFGTKQHHELAKKLSAQLYEKYSHVFRKKLPAGVPPVRFPGAECKVDLTPEGEKQSPPAQQGRPATAEQNAELKKQLESYLASGFGGCRRRRMQLQSCFQLSIEMMEVLTDGVYVATTVG